MAQRRSCSQIVKSAATAAHPQRVGVGDLVAHEEGGHDEELEAHAEPPVLLI